MQRHHNMLLELISFQASARLQDGIMGLRKTFASIFSTHYANLICNARESKTEEASLTLDGFQDLIGKFFPKGIHQYSKPDVIKRLYDIYFGAGFDDEAAFLWTFHDLSKKGMTPDKHYQAVRDRLSAVDQAEIDDYLRLLQKEKRELKDVNCLMLVDSKQNVKGFAIYHYFYQEGQPILHIRQAAMGEQGRGYASMMAAYLTDLYPHAIYEANQRKANAVPMKEALVKQGIVETIDAVLGYSDKYRGLRTKESMQRTYLQRLKKPLVKPFGLFGTYESLPGKWFSRNEWVKDAITDDCFLGREKKYLRYKPLR